MIPALDIAVVGTRENKYIRQICKQLGVTQTDLYVRRTDAKPAGVNENLKMDVPDDSRESLYNTGGQEKRLCSKSVFGIHVAAQKT